MCKHAGATLIPSACINRQSVMPKPDSSKDDGLQPETQIVFLMVEYPQGNTQLVKAAFNNYEHDMANQPHFLLQSASETAEKGSKVAAECVSLGDANLQSSAQGSKVTGSEITGFEPASIGFENPNLDELPEVVHQSEVEMGVESGEVGAPAQLPSPQRFSKPSPHHFTDSSPEHFSNPSPDRGEGRWESDSVSEEESVFHIISDKPVVCRARATLPINYLYFHHLNDAEMGVYARKIIPKKAKFGPVDGVLDPSCTTVSRDGSLQLLVRTPSGLINKLDISDEEKTNWMRYVRAASEPSEVNLEVVQNNSGLYFTTTRQLKAREELRVWYSPVYAASRNLPLFSDSENQKWKCPHCSYKSSSVETIYHHLSETHSQDKSSKKAKVFKRNTAKKNTTFGTTNIIHNDARFQSEDSISDSSLSSGPERFKQKSWCCTHCERCFNTPTMLNFHMLAHAADNLEASSLEAIQEKRNCSKCVQNKHHCCGNQENKPVNCDICSKRLRNDSALAYHIKTHSGKKYECPICKKTFDKVLGLKTHVHCHSENGVFTCTHCSKEFTLYKHIRKHIRSFHSAKIHKCSSCPKRFPSMDKLRKHQLCHTDKKQFLCSDCGKQFKRKDKLSDHMRKTHYLPEEPIVITRTSNAKGLQFGECAFKCHICMVGFKRRGMLVNHLASRHPDTPLDSIPELSLPILRTTRDYFCQYCDKIYKSSSKRKAHILKNHPGEKLPLSNRQLGSLKDLAGHENGTFSQTAGSVTTHPQACQWCHKQYASKAKLLQHQRVKHYHLLPKSLQSSRRAVSSSDEIEHSDDMQKSDQVKESSLFQGSLITLATEYELSESEAHYITEGEFIVDTASLKKALKADCGGLEEMLCGERSEAYLKGSEEPSTPLGSGPVVEVWDHLSLSPPPDSPFLPFPR